MISAQRVLFFSPQNGALNCFPEERTGKQPTPMGPDIKILAGNQVYLNSLWYKYVSVERINKISPS
jgi:hypothetical protein